jgi:hypothetical protein
MENPIHEDATLASVRSRSQAYLGYLFWVCVVLCLLWAANAVASLLEKWVTLLREMRRGIGLAAPVTGPDYWVIGGVLAFALLAVIGAGVAWSGYRAAWKRRLLGVWGTLPDISQLRIRPLRVRADQGELRQRTAYLQRITQSPEWSGGSLGQCADSREAYKATAALMLRSIEGDVIKRAVTAGLVIGLNRSPLIDALSIAASAFELQLHVLTRLGKRPSARTWIEMLKRTSASLFLNSYISREDALYLNLAIRKAALGLELAADSAQEAAGAMADIDWDEALGGMAVPGLGAVVNMATMTMSVGAFGLRHIGSFIETTANDLLQGVLAAGILYYHGMALAADCLALDEEHRRSPEMTRTIGKAMHEACVPAGRLLRDQVRRMRRFLRERRRMILGKATDAAKQGVDKMRTASRFRWNKKKQPAAVEEPGSFDDNS